MFKIKLRPVFFYTLGLEKFSVELVWKLFILEAVIVSEPAS